MNSKTNLEHGNIKLEAEFDYEPMDVNESSDYYEEGEINSSDDNDDDKKITVQMPSNVNKLFSKHFNKDVTKVKVFDKDESQRKLNRAKRFSIPIDAVNSEEVFKEKLVNLYKDLGIDKENERHYRFNAVHMRGTENMSTDDVLQYFVSYSPSHVEWINDVSCNIIWMDDVFAAKALINLSKKIKNLDKVHLNADPFEKFMKNDNNEEEIIFDDAVDARELTIPIPPGFWRIGTPCKQSSSLLLRYATKSDKKQRNAEKNSEYYKKYGNPHYGNIPGLISNSLRSGLKRSKVNLGSMISRNISEQALSRNPWEDLAYEWGKADVIETMDENLIRNYVTQNEPAVPDLRISLTSKKERLKRRRMSLESEFNSPNNWESKSKILRMKMYADEEEQKLGKRLNKSQTIRKEEKDLRTKINKKKRTSMTLKSHKKGPYVLRNADNEYDENSTCWDSEQYSDLRGSLSNNKRHEKFQCSVQQSDSDSDSEDERYRIDLSRRSPLQIEIENDEFYLKNKE